MRNISVHGKIQKYDSNSISTSKYNFFTFLPKFIYEQFRKYSNVFFLFISIIQQIPDVSPTGRFTTLVPLLIIITISAIKELVEDFKRKKSDHRLNNKPTIAFRNSGKSSNLQKWQNIKWKDIIVGDIVKVNSDEMFPCDLLFLSSSEENSICSVETSNLDGETNLKIKQSTKETSYLDNSEKLKEFRADIEYESPNHYLYEFKGNLNILDKKISLKADHILLRGSQLRNTKWVYGLALYTGHETKLMKNSRSPPFKRSQIDKITNKQIIILFMLLLILSLVSSFISLIWTAHESNHWYIGPSSKITFCWYEFNVTLMNFNGNSDLQVTLEMVRFVQAIFIGWDTEMYDAKNDYHATCRTSNLNEELGQIEYIFSDKTGTLTCNQMELKNVSINGIDYKVDESTSSQLLERKFDESVKNILILLSVCHTVMPLKKLDETIEFQASSPDEKALVTGASQLGVSFRRREPKMVSINYFGEEQTYEILNILEFDSTRKRMSVILRDMNGTIKLFCKGADNVILSRSTNNESKEVQSTMKIIEKYAQSGLRTLTLAFKEIPKEDYEEWNVQFQKANNSIDDREIEVDKCAEIIETNLRIIGATGIEDKLQDEVPETIVALKTAGIKVWILTGDKMETAINIGFACQFLTKETNLLYLTGENYMDVKRELSGNLEFVNKQKHLDIVFGLIIEGRTLEHSLSADCKQSFLELALTCNMVILCRATPKNKSQIIECIRKATKCVTLAIGDGANDVDMIQAAHIGVGIYGLEGTQALAASDYAIGQFRFLKRLLLVHGAWNYKRISKVIMFSFYKNICLYIIQLWFAMFNGFSGQNLFERWLIGLYNVVFTAAPPMILGLFDRSLPSQTLIRFPELYKMQIKKNEFNMKNFVKWLLNSIIHSLLIFFLSYGFLWHETLSGDGKIGDYTFTGNFVYLYCVAVVCLKAGLESDCWTILTHIAIWGSIINWFVFIAVYSQIYPTLDIGPEMIGMDTALFSSGIFWLGLLFVPIAVILPDVVFKAYIRTFRKSPTQRIQEHELEEKVNKRKLPRTRSNTKGDFILNNMFVNKVSQFYRGFAFSEEDKRNTKIKKFKTAKTRPTGY